MVADHSRFHSPDRTLAYLFPDTHGIHPPVHRAGHPGTNPRLQASLLLGCSGYRCCSQIISKCVSLTLECVARSRSQMYRLRRKATTGAMRARTEVGGVCFCVHGASGRALCGDKVAPRWQKPAALRPSLLPLRPQTTCFINNKPKGRTFETERFNTLKKRSFSTLPLRCQKFSTSRVKSDAAKK